MAFEFTPEGYQKFSQAVLDANGDQATLTGILADMQETFSGAVSTVADNTAKITTLEQDNQRLLAKTMDLFLRVGQTINQQQGTPAPAQKTQSTAEYMHEYLAKLK